MNYTLKLAIPLALGLAAAAVNLMVLRARTNPVTFIKVDGHLREGDLFTDAVLKPLEFPGNEAGNLKETAMLYTDRGVLLGQPALRELLPGDMVLYRDFPLRGDVLQLRDGESSQLIPLGGLDIPPSILQINYELDFLIQFDPEQAAADPSEAVVDRQGALDWIGPFRLVSIGNRVSNAPLRASAGGAANTITVAVKAGLERKPEGELTAEERDQWKRQRKLDNFARLEKQNRARLLNVRISTHRQFSGQ